MPAAQTPTARLLRLAEQAAAAYTLADALRAEAHAALRSARKAKGLTLEEAAQVTGVTRSALANAESGRHSAQLGADTLVRVARVLADRAA